MYNIPSKINSFNVYKDGTKLVGISDEVTLPDFQSMEIEIPFRQMDKDLFILSDDISSVTVTLRGSIQYTVNDSGATAFKPMRIVVRGKNKGLTGGKAKQGSGTASSIKLEILYILIEIDNVTEIELDKLNFVYKVHGKDLLEKVRKMC